MLRVALPRKTGVVRWVGVLHVALHFSSFVMHVACRNLVALEVSSRHTLAKNGSGDWCGLSWRLGGFSELSETMASVLS